MYYHEAALIDTKDGIQCKIYSNVHPKGFIVVKPKYIPTDLVQFKGLKTRFMFEKCVTRFNLFNEKEIVEHNLKKLKEKFPSYIHDCKNHNNWFFVVPEKDVARFHDTRKGLSELLKVPEKDMDPYLQATKKFIDLMVKAGIPTSEMGISHSTLLGNYTPGKSDIDVVIFGKENGWKAIKFLEKETHPSLKWKAKEDWARYYKDRIVSKVFSEEEYVFNMVRKRDDGYIDGNVFSIFCVENENEHWYDWDEKREPVGVATIRATVTDDYNSIVRPGGYEVKDSEILSFEGKSKPKVAIKRIVTWSRPFNLQARKGERVEACGLLEKVKGKKGEYYEIVIGYMDTYTTDRGEKEYLKALVK